MGDDDDILLYDDWLLLVVSMINMFVDYHCAMTVRAPTYLSTPCMTP
jgi:hypothetical protein